MSEDTEEHLTGVFAAIVIGLCFFGSIYLTSLVVSYLWLWFVTPTFGVSVPNLPTIYGLLLLISLTRRTPDNFPKRKDARAVKRFFLDLYARPLLVLFVGWLAHSFA